jgi:1-acyl-sn-glycerol-3-phosphate acyltransferase
LLYARDKKVEDYRTCVDGLTVVGPFRVRGWHSVVWIGPIIGISLFLRFERPARGADAE